MSVTKGSIAMVDNIWYVVVSEKDGHLYCICDHANNIHSWHLSDCRAVYSAHDAMWANSWSPKDDRLRQLMSERSIPVCVIAEVLAGCHDDRFDHWTPK